MCFFLIVGLGCSSSDGALSGCEMSRYRYSPGWNQEGSAGARPTWSSGEVLPGPATSSGADQSDIRWPLLSRHGEKITHALHNVFMVRLYIHMTTVHHNMSYSKVKRLYSLKLSFCTENVYRKWSMVTQVIH